MFSKIRTMKNAACFLAFVVLVFSPLLLVTAHAQVAGATLSGTVSDQSGGVLPQAAISIKNIATGITRTSATSTAGFYSVPNLLPGSYEIRASAQGFSTELQSGITLTVGEQQILNFTLQVGQISQTVEVSTEAPTVELASSSISAVINSTTVRELPLNGRSWTDLATLQPGVNSTLQIQADFAVGGDRGNRGFGTQITVAGARPEQNNFRLDGVSINDFNNAAPGSVLGGDMGVDAVQEFSVLTSNVSAEYGRTSGGVINAITKSGTNQFHGGVYEFLRNDHLDAANFFENAGGVKKASFRQNQFGVAAGGPIRKDKLFVFGDYEGLRRSKGIPVSVTVPSRAARGIAPGGTTPSQVAVVNGAPLPLESPCLPNTCVSDPVTHIDKLVLPYLAMYPLPNGPENGDLADFNFVGHRIVREDFFTTRVDHHFSQKDSLFGTYMFDRTPFTSDEPLGVVLLGALTKRQIAAVEETHTFNQSFINTVRLGYNRDAVDNNRPVSAILPAAGDTSLASIPGKYAPACLCPNIGTFMEGGLGGAPTYLYRWNSYQVYDDAFLTRGRHSLKFGFGFERDQNNQLTTGNRDGQFKFGSMKALLTNNKPNQLSATPPALLTERGFRQSIVGAYFQDDWRLRPSLTLNLGLRYEMSTVPFDNQGQTSNAYNLTDPLPHCGKLVTGCVATGPYFYNPTLRDFAPRVGFAWDPFHNGKTAVRGGFGIVDSLPLLYQYLTLNGQVAPFFSLLTTKSLPAGSFPSGAYSILTTIGKSTPRFGSLEPHPKRNYVMQWNLNIQRELFHDLTATIGYVGSHGVHQPFRVDDADLVLPKLTSAGYLFPL